MDPRVQCVAVAALGKIGPEAATAVPTLVELLADEDLRVRIAAVCALGDIGPAARTAIPALKTLAQQEIDDELRGAVAEALRQIVKDGAAR